MKRIVVVSSGLAGAKAAARIKRLAPEVEVNLVIPGGEEKTPVAGPFSSLTASRHISETLTEARQVGVIRANEVQFDFEQQMVIVRSNRGVIQIKFNEVVLEVDASARLPRSLRTAENVIPWPLEDGAPLDTWLGEAKPASAVVVGNGMALGLLDSILASGMRAVWVRTADSAFDKDIWEHLVLRVQQAAGGRLEAQDWSDTSAEALVPVLDDAGQVTSLQDGQGHAVSGDIVFWTEPQRALHPIIAESGVELDASGLIAVDSHFSAGANGPAGLHIIGSGVAVSRLPLHTPGAPVASVALQDTGVIASARVVASHLAGFVNETAQWQGTPGVFRHEAAGIVLCKAGLSVQEATAAGFEPEFALQRMKPTLNGSTHAPVAIKLICDRHSHSVLGVQVVGEAGSPLVEAVVGAVATAISASLTVERLAAMDFAAGGELVQRAASILSNKLLYRFSGISAEEVVASRAAGASFFTLDLRDNVSWKNGHIEDAYNIPYPQLKKRLQDEVPRFTPIVLVSATSDEAYSAACHLFGLGATDLFVLDGGMDMWPYDLVKG